MTRLVKKECGKHFGMVAGECSKCKHLDNMGANYTRNMMYVAQLNNNRSV